MLRDVAWDFERGDFVLDAGGRLVMLEGPAVIRSDLTARLTSPRDSHWAHPGEGFDAYRYVNATADDTTLLEFRQEVELEAERDRRVLLADATVTTPDLRTGRVNLVARLTQQAVIDVGLLLTGGRLEP